MSKILYIKKKPNTVKWSDVLQRQFEALRHLSGGQVDLYEVDTGGLLAYWKNVRRIARLLREHDYTVVYVNHVICSYPVVLSRLFYRKKGVTTVLSLHEGEPVMGWKFVKEHGHTLGMKEKLRYTRFLQWPLPFFDKLVVLNNRQKLNRRLAARYTQLNFLGVDVETFGNVADVVAQERLQIFFPNDPGRPEKGFALTQEALKGLSFAFDLTVGGAIPHQEMHAAYGKSQVVVLSTWYETYSMVLLEAMAANRFIVVTHTVGLAENLLEHSPAEALAAYGLFVVDPAPEALRAALEHVYRLAATQKPATRDLLGKEKLTEQDCNERLYKFLSNFQRSQSPSHA